MVFTGASTKSVEEWRAFRTSTDWKPSERPLQEVSKKLPKTSLSLRRRPRLAAPVRTHRCSNAVRLKLRRVTSEPEAKTRSCARSQAMFSVQRQRSASLVGKRSVKDVETKQRRPFHTDGSVGGEKLKDQGVFVKVVSKHKPLKDRSCDVQGWLCVGRREASP